MGQIPQTANFTTNGANTGTINFNHGAPQTVTANTSLDELAKARMHADPQQIAEQRESSELLNNAGSRIKSTLSKGIKWISKIGMVAGGAASLLGYLVLGKILLIPGLIFTGLCAALYFSQPASKDPITLNYEEIASKLDTYAKEPHNLEDPNSANTFRDILKEQNSFSPEQKELILAKLNNLTNKFLNIGDYPNQKDAEAVMKVQDELGRTIRELERDIANYKN